MEIIQDWPPNIEQIKQAGLKPKRTTVFCFGDKIYNPHKIEIPPDVLFHESIHQKQQKEFSAPEIWWMNYLLDRKFRSVMEIEAYAAQYLFVKKHVPRAAKDCLDDLAKMLSGEVYDLGLTFWQVYTLIRKKSKELSISNL